MLPDESPDGTLPERGGPFPTTRWSLVLAVGGSGVNSEDALESLCRIYWPPVYSYARHRGYSTEHAEDLTQGFFAKLLEKHYLDRADRERGKFRTFLLSSFKNYMANEWDRSQTEKRGGGQWFVSLDFTDAERWAKIEPADKSTPETVFVQRWARTLVGQVLDRLYDEAIRDGNTKRFDCLKGFLAGSDQGVAYRVLAKELEMTESAVKVAVHRLRKRFGRLLREEVEGTVEDREAVGDEIRYLLEALGS